MTTKAAKRPSLFAANEHAARATKLEWRAQVDAGEKLPPGVCGRISGIALVYNQVDDYGTVFKPGCLAKTRAERVNTGKVKLFADHGPFTDTHVGTVRTMEDVGDAVVMTADLFDTEAGRQMKEYIDAVIKSGGETGLSVGFRPRKKEWVPIDPKNPDGEDVLEFQEIELREVSITPVPAVPGAEVTSVRREAGESEEDLLKRTLARILRALPQRDAQAVFDEVYASAAEPDKPAVPPTQPPASADGASAEPRAESAAASGAPPKAASEAQRVAALRGLPIPAE